MANLLLRVTPYAVADKLIGSMDGQAGHYCDECGSEYRAETSSMDQLCPECAHRLYSYPNCEHDFVDGRCRTCGWDGSESDYLKSMRQ
ncbi:hypothetical protein Pla108_42010 [Botrimarina colliarenosi]|uniref:Uncharacterized protein n=1 Tax=Botrimarina colliarenosi TaxID=2528001 RepID=A0A5C5ZXS0_9BACT|nr:hypothetical protein Pla108_42010 [Botrimarina colliarenosi]